MSEFQLTKTQKIILGCLANSPLKSKFYWTGGTALAFFYLKHRESHDIDLFSAEQFRYQDILPLVTEIKNKLGLAKVEEKKIFDRWEFFLKNGQEARLDFNFYDFKNLEPRKDWQGVIVDSLADMAANKTMALIDRHDPKDVFDIYYLMKKEDFSVKKLLELVEKKFKVKFSATGFWAEMLKASKELANIKPLLISQNSEDEIETIIDFCEDQAGDLVKKEF